MDEMYNYGVDGIGNRTGGCMPGNRPVCCSNVTGRGIAKTYDHMGRMAGRVEAQDGTVSHERYLYRGYLRIAALDMLNNAALIHAAVWDPTEPAATRPLLLQTPSGCFTYAFDQAKNVTELFDSAGGIAAAYDHGPFGEDMAATGPAAGFNPFRFSSEVWDGALGLVCYNWRHYNPLDGRFISRDPIEERGGLNLYGFVGNDPVNRWDALGLFDKTKFRLVNNLWTWDHTTCSEFGANGGTIDEYLKAFTKRVEVGGRLASLGVPISVRPPLGQSMVAALNMKKNYYYEIKVMFNYWKYEEEKAVHKSVCGSCKQKNTHHIIEMASPSDKIAGFVKQYDNKEATTGLKVVTPSLPTWVGPTLTSECVSQ